MAFDGITVSCLVHECSELLTGGRLYKIAQPEADELLLTVKCPGGTYRLIVSASATLPIVKLTEENKPSPMTAPNFCMLLRKHLQNGRITKIHQPGLERAIHIEVEHLDEMGDLCAKTLIVELMGKHSNIIFCSNGIILDSIKHISAAVSSVREVLPGRPYFLPETMEKADPLSIQNKEEFVTRVSSVSYAVSKALYSTLTGLSPIIAQDLCLRAGIDSDLPVTVLETAQWDALFCEFAVLMNRIATHDYVPELYLENGVPKEFSAVPLRLYDDLETEEYGSISTVLDLYYSRKEQYTRIRQKSADLRRIVQTALERNYKKYDLQSRQMKDTEKRDKYKVYGELLNTYGYGIPEGATSTEALNYYTNEMITIPLDPQLTPQENARKYFDRYGKLKRTREALEQQLSETGDEIRYLESISASLEIAEGEADLNEIREELRASGYIRSHGTGKKSRFKSIPLHFISSDGYDIYVGKNNLQNDNLTHHVATGNDWWFHSKKYPGSHVIVRSRNEELPDRTFEEAARLAAHYCKASGADKVEIDYVQKKHLKKPNGGHPGFVIYHTNYSMVAETDISGIQQIND